MEEKNYWEKFADLKMMLEYAGANVIIPPKEIWASIQSIRQQHDTNYRRWMPPL